MPQLFVDFVEGAQPARHFFGSTPDSENLRMRAASVRARPLPRQELCDRMLEQALRFGGGEPALANIAKLSAPHTVAVVATLRPGLFGGPLCSWLKAFTAARLAAWLTEHGQPAVPVGWIDSRIETGDLSIGLLAPEGPQQFELLRVPSPTARIPSRIQELLTRVADTLEVRTEDSEVLQLLESAYVPGTDFVLAWGRSISRFLDRCGLILFDPTPSGSAPPSCCLPPSVAREKIDAVLAEQERRLNAAGYGPMPMERSGRAAGEQEGDNPLLQWLPPLIGQSLCLPVVATVMDDSEVYSFARDQSAFPELRLQPPVIWPRVSATVTDARSRKVLARYGLRLGELFAGPEVVTEGLMRRLSVGETLARINQLKVEIEERLRELAGLVPLEDKLSPRIDKSRRRMLYQIEKLKARFSDAQQRRREALTCQVARLCNSLAPWGRFQEKEFAGFQFMQRHSRALPQRLYDSIDPWRFEHQLIYL